MELIISDLEKRLFESPEPDLAWGALVASGVRPGLELDDYLAWVHTLCQTVSAFCPADDEVERARQLFEWLWRTKPQRYEFQGAFRMTEVLDAQLDPELARVGNCLGLTLLYNVLGQGLGLEVGAVFLEEAFGRGAHVFSLLRAAEAPVDIENIFPDGFDYRGHLGDPQRIVWGNVELIADVYHSIGWALHEQEKLAEAIQRYSKALLLNPSYTRAHLNRGIAYAMMGRDKEAREDFGFCGDEGARLCARMDGG